MLGSIVDLFRFAVATFVAGLVVNIIIGAYAYIYARHLRARAGERKIRDRLTRYARIATGLENRVDARKATAAGAASVLFGTERQEKGLRNRLRELENAPYRFVRMLGAEQFPNKGYEFLVFNSSVSHQVKRGERHPFFDSSWARPCPVHVWARSAEDAVADLERAFPRASGFKTVFSQPLASGPAGTVLPPEEISVVEAETAERMEAV